MAYELGFLGAGNMAEAIARAALQAKVLEPGEMIAADPSEDRRQIFQDLGIAVETDNTAVVKAARHVLLAVKPQTLPDLAGTLRAVDPANQVLISIMAGVRMQQIADMVGAACRVVRVMPNTPMMAGVGMAGVAMGSGAQRGDDELAMRLFASGGAAVQVQEDQLDAITAISGSGPAYVFYLAEAMQQAADELGLAQHAAVLVEQTVLGAATLLKQSPDSAAELRRKVASPGGTTQAALDHLDATATRQAVIDAIKAARHRSVELGSA